MKEEGIFRSVITYSPIILAYGQDTIQQVGHTVSLT
jgi:hypothetical protein